MRRHEDTFVFTDLGSKCPCPNKYCTHTDLEAWMKQFVLETARRKMNSRERRWCIREISEYDNSFKSRHDRAKLYGLTDQELASYTMYAWESWSVERGLWA